MKTAGAAAANPADTGNILRAPQGVRREPFCDGGRTGHVGGRASPQNPLSRIRGSLDSRLAIPLPT